MRRPKHAAFSLVEFVLAIVFLGVVLGPLLHFVARIHDLNSAVGQQGRREALRSFHDQAVAWGVMPERAEALRPGLNRVVPAVPALEVTALDASPAPGRARIVPLRVVLDTTVAEPRIAGSGFQLGAGTALPPRNAPTPPLPPIVMPRPTLDPVPNAIVAATALNPSADGRPHHVRIQATSNADATVRLALNTPHASVSALGVATREVTAVDLLGRVNGNAWTEYTGNTAAGDRAVVLGDGRTRWHVKTSEGRHQIIEPSVRVEFSYRIGLGAPVLRDGESEHASGAALGFDYPGFVRVGSGEAELVIDFPSRVKAAFGTAWSSQLTGFAWSFGTTAGPFTGSLKSFFQPDALPLWGDTVTVTATPVVPVGGVAEPATWSFSRLKTSLGPPVLSTAANSGFFAPGRIEFVAPLTANGTRVGRLSFNDGTLLSTGPTLGIQVSP